MQICESESAVQCNVAAAVSREQDIAAAEADLCSRSSSRRSSRIRRGSDGITSWQKSKPSETWPVTPLEKLSSAQKHSDVKLPNDNFHLGKAEMQKRGQIKVVGSMA